MRKSIFYSVAFIFLSFGTSFGQFGIDISAGINNSKVKLDGFELRSTDSRSGYFVGLAPNYRIGDRFKVLVDLQLSQKGFQETVLNSVTVENRIVYFDIIPEVEIKILDFLSLGTGFNYGIKTKLEFKDNITDWQSGNGIDFAKSYDYGVTGKVKIQFWRLFAFARYNYGLNNIDRLLYISPNGEKITGNKTLNRNLQFGAGFSF